LSVFKDFSAAIPIRYVSSLVLHYSEAEKAVSHDEKTRNTYFSLPHLFNCPDEPVKHGIVLKIGGADDDPGSVVENKNILLLPEIDRETDIPPENIYPLPKTLLGIYGKKSALITGIQFANIKRGGGDGAVMPVLFLNPGLLVETTVYQLYRGKV
jgi:hypothetical protein